MTEEKEIWKDVKGYEGLYCISNHGNVRSIKKIIDKGKWGIVVFPQKRLKPINDREYLFVNLYKNKKVKKTAIHVLVATHFILNPKNKPQVNHKDGNKSNPYYKNLEWVTHKENAEHASKNNLVARNFGERNGQSKLTIDDIYVIRNSRWKIKREELANKFKVSVKHIDRIRQGKRWTHIE